MKANVKKTKKRTVQLTGNSQLDYDLGFKHGQAQGLIDTFQTHTFVLLPAMWNAKDDDIISDEYFAEFVKKTEAEIQRILDYYFEGDITKIKALQDPKDENCKDRVKQVLNMVNEMRQKCGMDKI